MKLKSIWQRFIAWITFDKTKVDADDEILKWNREELPRILDEMPRREIAVEHTDEVDIPLHVMAENKARIEGITLEQAASQLNSVYRSGEEPITTTLLHTLDAGEEVISIKRDKMHELIEQKKNRTPFYKDDNKKTWE